MDGVEIPESKLQEVKPRPKISLRFLATKCVGKDLLLGGFFAKASEHSLPWHFHVLVSRGDFHSDHVSASLIPPFVPQQTKECKGRHLRVSRTQWKLK